MPTIFSKEKPLVDPTDKGTTAGKQQKQSLSLLQTFRILLQHLSFSEKCQLGLAFFGLFGSSMNNLFIPTLARMAVDRNLVIPLPSAFLPFLSFSGPYFVTSILSILGAGAFLGWVRVYFFGKVSNALATRLRKALFSSVVKQQTSLSENPQAGSLMIRLIQDADISAKMISTDTSSLARSCNSAIGGTAALFLIAPKLTFCTLSVVPIIGSVAMIFSSYLKKLRNYQQQRFDKAIDFGEERIANLVTLRQFAQEDTEIQRFSDLLEGVLPTANTVAFAEGVFMGGLSFSLYSTLIVLLLFGGSLVASEELTAGKLAAFGLYSSMVGLGFSGLSQAYGNAVKASVSASRVLDVLNSEEAPLNEGLTLSEVSGELEIENLSFMFPSRKLNVLEDLSITVKRGEVLAFTGPSGVGKTTLFHIITCLYPIKSGTIYLDKVDLSTLNPSWLRSSVFGVVNQEPYLFSGTVRENIMFGKSNATEEEVRSAALLANAGSFIDALPDQYETLLGRNGFQLSTGQKQRICIARAIIRNPPILILDEATSALDADAERQVHAALERAMKDRTVLMTAHRESTLRYADRIALLLDGRIHAVGTFEEMSRLDEFKELLQTFQDAA